MGSEILTQRQKSILVGSLLGDATIELRWRNARARFDHSVKQKDYLFWKYSELQNITTSKPRLVKQSIHWQTKKIYTNWHFSTKAISELNEYRHIFYRNNRKVVPINISEIFTDPLSLAVWIMDDGYKRNDCDAVRISTEAFTLEENRLLISCLNDNFHLQATIHRKGKWLNLYIPQPSMMSLRNLLKVYILPSMRYKISPVTTSFFKEKRWF